MRLIRDHILRTVNGTVVLVPYSDRETDFSGMIVLNETGEFVCRMLEQDISRAELLEGLAREYDRTVPQMEADLDAFLADLRSCHMLVEG